QPFQLPLSGAALRDYLCSHSSLLVANSEASAAALRPVLDPDRLVVVPNGIELGRFAKLSRAPKPKVVIGMVANLTSRWKKHLLFAEAARLAPGPSYRLYGHAPEPG